MVFLSITESPLGNSVFVGPNACFTNDRVPRVFDPEWEVVPDGDQRRSEYRC